MKAACIFTAVSKCHLPFVWPWVKYYYASFPAEDIHILFCKGLKSQVPGIDVVQAVESEKRTLLLGHISVAINELLKRYSTVVYTKPTEFLLCEDPIMNIARNFGKRIGKVNVIAPVHLDTEVYDNHLSLIEQRQYCVEKKPHAVFTRSDLGTTSDSDIGKIPDSLLVDMEFIDKRFIDSKVLRSYDNKTLVELPAKVKRRLNFLNLDMFAFERDEDG